MNTRRTKFAILMDIRFLKIGWMFETDRDGQIEKSRLTCRTHVEESGGVILLIAHVQDRSHLERDVVPLLLVE